jgi:hypothetical protein
MVEPGWKVLAADGREVGQVDEVAGDSSQDIFNGLAIATSALTRPRYVPAERVAAITEGAVRLTLTADQVERLGEYVEPAPSETIRPGKRSLLRRVFRR